MKYFILMTAALLMTGCAKRADSVAPTIVPPNSVSCDQRAEITTRVAMLTARQNQTANNDTIGVLILGLPTSSMNGKDVEADLSIAKGQLLAVEAKCG
jgi:hypothetical protein